MLEQNYQIIMAFVEVGTLLIWVVFAQLFFLTMKRQRRTRFLIHTEGYDCHSMKIVFTNMAAEPVFVRNIFFSVEDDDGKEIYNLDDLHGEKLFKKEVYGRNKWEYQGSILPGTRIKLEVGGIFVPCLLKCDKRPRYDAVHIEPDDIINIFVVYFHGADKRLLGASRHFRFFQSANGDYFSALNWKTDLWATGRERKKLMQALKQDRKDYPGFH